MHPRSTLESDISFMGPASQYRPPPASQHHPPPASQYHSPPAPQHHPPPASQYRPPPAPQHHPPPAPQHHPPYGRATRPAPQRQAPPSHQFEVFSPPSSSAGYVYGKVSRKASDNNTCTFTKKLVIKGRMNNCRVICSTRVSSSLCRYMSSSHQYAAQ